MDEDLMFNLEDINISQETMDYISDGSNSEVEDRLSTKQDETIKPGNDEDTFEEDPDGQSTEINDKEVDSKETEDGKEAEKSSQEEAPSPDNSSNDSTLYALAQYLKGEGVLFIEEDLKDIKSLEDLKDLMKQSNEKARYSNLNESQRRYQEALETGIPKSQFEEVEKEIQTFANIKDEDVVNNANLRYEIMAIDLMNQGIEQTKALKLAKLSLTDETNVQDAREALDNIKLSKQAKFDELKNTVSTAKTHDIDEFKKSIFSKESMLDQKMNDVTKNKLFDLITTKVDADDEGRPLNEMQKWQRDNPVESSVMLNYLFLMTEKGKNMNLINKTSTSKATKELERKLKSMSFASDGSLIIPDQLTQAGNNRRNTGAADDNNKNKNNLTINI